MKENLPIGIWSTDILLNPLIVLKKDKLPYFSPGKTPCKLDGELELKKNNGTELIISFKVTEKDNLANSA